MRQDVTHGNRRPRGPRVGQILETGSSARTLPSSTGDNGVGGELFADRSDFVDRILRRRHIQLEAGKAVARGFHNAARV